MTEELKPLRLPEGLALLREPFPANQISRLPKPTKRQTQEVKDNFKAGVRCQECGGWHHPKVVHLDYVGHAALTDRLLNADPEWNWEPVAFDPNGSPLLVGGGLWIRLTVCGVTRLGYGDAQDKQGHNAIKEAIGDALRNAAMRFGAALDLWHKGDLHDAKPEEDDGPQKPEQTEPEKSTGPCLRNGSRNPAWIGAMSKDQLFNTFTSYIREFEGADSISVMDEIKASADFKTFYKIANNNWQNLVGAGWRDGEDCEWNVGIKGAYDIRKQELQQLQQ